MSTEAKKPAGVENSPDLSGVFTPCCSGRHFWYFEEDAQMCCRGFKQIIVFDPEKADTWLYLAGWGYKWVPEEEAREA